VTTKGRVGLQSALRALLPVAAVIVGLHTAGVIHEWRDLLSFDTVMAILAALLLKGASSAVTAKDVTVQPR
jgi:uncharacterized membrane protein YoaK (UPF0700 family)